jgi:tRNA modification GTPase
MVRLSGPEAKSIAARLFQSKKPGFTGFAPYRLHHGILHDQNGRPLDDVLAAFMPGPNSYTGEDVVEFTCHGSPAILRAVVAACLALSARHAEPGEFTRRAFLLGRMDLSQAQAVAELAASDTLAGASLALARLEGLMGRRVGELRAALEELRANVCLAVDFPEDEAECLDPAGFGRRVDAVLEGLGRLAAAHARARPFREGALAVLAGPVNAGKSSLFNALAGRERAIVCAAPGTTRDFLEEQLDLDGLPVRLVDTAGLRETREPVEREGLRRARMLLDECGAALLVADGSRDFDPAAFTAESGLTHGEPPAFPAESGQAGNGPAVFMAGAGLSRLDPAKVLAVVNKADLPRAANDPFGHFTRLGFTAVRVSARTGEGMDELCALLRSRLLGAGGPPPESEPAPNDRELALIDAARRELTALLDDLGAGVPPDLLGVRLETACWHLSGITGEITPDEVLNAVFERFCMGK